MDKNKPDRNLSASTKSNSILVIRLSALGDVAMSVPVLIALRENYPNLEITVLSNVKYEPFFSHIPYVNFHAAKVKTTHKGLFGLFELYREISVYNNNSIADLHNVIRSQIIDLLAAFSGKKIQRIDKGRKQKKDLTKGDQEELPQLKSTHERYVEVFSELGYNFSLFPTHVLLRRKISPKILVKLGQEPKKWIGIAPFAAHMGKMYPLDLMEKVVADLASNEKYKVILFGGGKKEVDILNNLASKYRGVINLAGQCSFEDELSVISNLDIMLSMDSGNGHLAAMFGIPVVTLWGVTHPALGFKPFMQPDKNQLLSDRVQFPLIPTSVYGNKVPDGYENVMRTISPQRVINRINEILG